MQYNYRQNTNGWTKTNGASTSNGNSFRGRGEFFYQGGGESFYQGGGGESFYQRGGGGESFYQSGGGGESFYPRGGGEPINLRGEGENFYQRGGRGSWQRARGGRRGAYGGGRGGFTKKQNVVANWDTSELNDAFKKEKFYCCSCERGFKIQEQLDEHFKEHTVCGLDGCQFEAHSLVVTKHIRMQHDGNLYERMKNLNTPEDVDRWRTERKKNYPTLESAKQKEDELKGKLERGEICEVSPRGRKNAGFQPTVPVFRYRIQDDQLQRRYLAMCEQRMRKIERMQGDEWMNCSFAPDPNVPGVRVPLFSLNQSKVVSLESFYLDVNLRKGEGNEDKVQKRTKVKWNGFLAKKLDRLPDSESEIEDADIPISDEEISEDEPSSAQPVGRVTTSQCHKPIVAASSNKSSNNPLKNLMLVAYSSESEEENECDDKTRGTPPSSTQSINAASTTNQVLQSTLADTSTQDIACSKITAASTEENDMEMMEIEEFARNRPVREKRFVGSGNYNFKHRKRGHKLLETLLQDQIRKERNTILQVCRFICENNFLDKKKVE